MTTLALYLAAPEDAEELPPGWCRERLGNLLPLRYGRGLTAEKRVAAGSVPVYGSGGIVGSHTLPLTSGPTVIVGRKGSIGEVHFSPTACWPIDTTYYIEEQPTIHLRFAYYLLRSLTLGQQDKSTAIPSLRREDYDAIEVMLPPLAEQRRIVAALDDALARVNAIRERLGRAPALLKRFRASVLAAAVEGRLTEDWRAAHPDVEPASVLLDRILAERRRRWEDAEADRYRKAGKTPPLDWRTRYKEPAAPDTSELAELPEGWCWASLSQTSDIQGGIQKQPSRAPRHNAFPFLRVANVMRGRLDLEEVHSIELFDGELDRLRLKRDDLLIIEGNGSRSEIGRMAIWNASISDCVHQNHIIRARLIDGLSPRFVEGYWNSPAGSELLAELAVTSAGLYNLSVSKVGALPVPLASSDEQAEIVRRMSELIQSAEAIEERVMRASEYAERAAEALLAKAFRGELVAQDTADEPAAVTLARVARGTQTQIATSRARRGRT